MTQRNATPTATGPAQPIILTAQNLGKVVQTQDERLTILEDISFRVAAGEAIAIVGASGSGKSTLLGLLAGLDLPTSGTVLIEGQDIFSVDEDARARVRGEKMGFVFQSFLLLPSLPAIEHVMLPLELAGRPDAEDSARALPDRVGLGHRLTHYPKSLSGGEQQRVALARAFAPGPRILLADEPTGNLDAHTGAQIIELLFEMNAELGTTLVLVTHDPALAQRCARRLTLSAGRMV